MTKSILLFCAKSAGFTIIFWALWTWGLAFSRAEQNSTAAQNAQALAQVAAYEKQVARVNHQLDVVENQQKRMEENISEQEKIVKRFNALLSVWEKQSASKK